MRKATPSRTAANTAFARATEAAMRPDERICHDPYAEFFLPPFLGFVYAVPFLRRRLLSNWDFLVPGVVGSVIARTRFIDDYLAYYLERGVKQLVILGAGYDTRAFRIEKSKETVPVFELDHPATQKSKKEIVKGLFGKIPEHVRYIPVDFERDRVEEKLLRSDYDAGLETFFIWEGVTYYLSSEAVDLTLDLIAAHSPPESRLVFDYFPPCAADGTCEIPGAGTLGYGLEKFGEKITFGIDPKGLESFLWKRGFRLEINMNCTDCEKLFFKRERKLCALFNFAAARVREKP